VPTTTDVATTPMATSNVTGSLNSDSLSTCTMLLVTLCNGAGVSRVKLNASPVHAVMLVWNENTTVSYLTAALSLATISQLEVDALQPAPIAL
jgi:hypothetical protein